MPLKKIRTVDIALIAYIISIFLFTAESDEIFISEIFFLIYAALVLFKIIRKDHGKINVENVCYLLPIFIFAIISVPFAINSRLAFEKVRTLFLLIVMFIAMCNTYTKEGNPNFILVGFLAGGTIRSIQVLSQYGLEAIHSGLISGMRMGEDILQLSYLGRYTYIAAVTALFFAYYKGKKPLYILYIFCGFISISSGSRQSLITLILVSVMLFMMKDFSKQKVYRLMKGLLAVAMIVAIFRLPALKAVTERLIAGLTLQESQYVSEMSDFRRVEMIRQGLIAFTHNPLYGIGLGNVREIVYGTISEYKYLHNNYVELLCCGGIVGFCCYYYIYVCLFKKIKKCRKMKQSDETVLAFCLLVGQLFSDMFAVNYYGKIQYIIFAYCFILISRGRASSLVPDSG